MDENEAVVKSEDKGDRVSKNKTIYEAGAGEIFWKNFLAGFSRTMGGLFVYFFILVILGGVLYNLVLPKAIPVINSYINIFNSLSSPANNNSKPDYPPSQNLEILKLLGQ